MSYKSLSEPSEVDSVDSIFDVVRRHWQDSDSNGSQSDLSEVENDPRPMQPAISVSGDLPSTAFDEVAWALVESVRPAFESASQQYWAGLEGPYVLDGDWTLETYEAFATTLETRWQPAYQDRRIMLFGDPNTVHESLIGSSPKSCSWSSGGRGRIHLFRNLYRSTCKWQLTSTSISPHCKEADVLIRAHTATTKENGLAVEIAHLNESFERLCREVQDWTSGDGERALLAVGLKVDTKSPYQVWNLCNTWALASFSFLHSSGTTPGSGSSFVTSRQEPPHSIVASVVPRRAPRFGPPTAVRVSTHSEGEECLIEHVEPVHPESEDMLVQIPIGAALFSDLVPDAFAEELGFTLTDAYVEDLKAKQWTLDLGYLRYVLMDKIIKKDMSGCVTSPSWV
ncbi:hypothetical protein GGX14DRAFT_399432 [Mycena pura]|uniref:Uncharacterized protein n=1 Tax=Mycena pura TaxID=153505 RepID=A0AAD6Y6Z2_9AGAR|nr:hypothetical protein GGX14DRAFT_399432 [Mycena pura]